ncbi:MAG: FAD-binding oxidoreductase [Cyanobium sp. LacPavin_0920_WC12_MAG_62_9]|nr:FAD-binding oxidoreductase [Cyanobium sp. LacPavin_0920_WC12_MAG_62_9]
MTPEPSELQELVRTLHQQASPWLPAGLGTRLDWGPKVSPGSAVVSCQKLNQILEHSPGDFTVRVQAGTPLVELQAALAHHGQWLAVDAPWGQPSQGSIGGLVARGLAGGFRQRYLGVRDQVIGISLLRADGTAAKAGGQVVKNVAGYDLMRLLAGSWGSLALITELNLRTLPIPPERRGLWISGELEGLATLSRWLLASSLSPERVDWQRQGPGPWGLLISLASISGPTLAEQISCLQAKATDFGLEAEELDRDALEARETQGRGPAESMTNPAWLLRLGVKPSGCAELLRELSQPNLDALGVVLSAGSGLGYAWANGADLPGYKAEALRRLCHQLGGYLTVLKQPATSELPAWLDAQSRPMALAIKRQFDPKQQLARGRLPGVQPTPAL